MSELPLFPVTTVGSWPRPAEVQAAQRELRYGRSTPAEFDRVADRAVERVIRLQEEAGCDLVTDGELRRDNFYSFVSRKLGGVRLMTLAEMLDVVEDKAGFERLLQTLDVPAYAISTPVCVGRINRLEPLVLDEYLFTREHTTRAVKVTLPGPYLLMRAMFVPEVTREIYDTKEALADEIVRLLRDEVASLAAAGADFVQLDEPVLTELAFSPGNTRTFMCAALSARSDPAEELALGVSLINRVVEGMPVRIGVHVCRGNWSRDESTLLRGSYAALAPHFEQIKAAQLVLEYATARAGELLAFGPREIGLGVVNPRTDTVETPEEIRAAVERARALYPDDRIFLNPDCGFGTFSRRPMNSEAIALAKIRSMASAARLLRPA
jgi:5-methyltetrahydropteroyltriglutamate--homocysteine methyltransferase